MATANQTANGLLPLPVPAKSQVPLPSICVSFSPPPPLAVPSMNYNNFEAVTLATKIRSPPPQPGPKLQFVEATDDHREEVAEALSRIRQGKGTAVAKDEKGIFLDVQSRSTTNCRGIGYDTVEGGDLTRKRGREEESQQAQPLHPLSIERFTHQLMYNVHPVNQKFVDSCFVRDPINGHRIQFVHDERCFVIVEPMKLGLIHFVVLPRDHRVRGLETTTVELLEAMEETAQAVVAKFGSVASCRELLLHYSGCFGDDETDLPKGVPKRWSGEKEAKLLSALFQSKQMAYRLGCFRLPVACFEDSTLALHIVSVDALFTANAPKRWNMLWHSDTFCFPKVAIAALRAKQVIAPLNPLAYTKVLAQATQCRFPVEPGTTYDNFSVMHRHWIGHGVKDVVKAAECQPLLL